MIEEKDKEILEEYCKEKNIKHFFFKRGTWFFFQEFFKVLERELRECDSCVFYQLIPVPEQNEIFDDCLIKQEKIDDYRKPCSRWIWNQSHEHLENVLGELQHVLGNTLRQTEIRLKTEELNELMNRFKDDREQDWHFARAYSRYLSGIIEVMTMDDRTLEQRKTVREKQKRRKKTKDD